jgi:DNA-binding response OmpR family regulator
VRTVVRLWLEDDRFQITEAMSGAGALELLAREPFDCGILDLHLTDMTGVDVLKSAHYAVSTPPWLVMTGNLSEETYHDLQALGITDDAILTKPIFDMRSITTKILAFTEH